MGPVTLCDPGGVTAGAGDTPETGELATLPGGVLTDVALRRFFTISSAESFLPKTFLFDLKIRNSQSVLTKQELCKTPYRRC